MTTANHNDTQAAIASLSRALETVERISGVHEAHIQEIDAKRKAYLVQTAGEMLPAINKRVLQDLRARKRLFVTREVEKAFAENRKFLGFFATAKYHQALSMLQTRLASHLDETKHGDLEAMDAKIAELTDKIEHLRAQGKETRELLKLLQQALKKDLDLPAYVKDHVSKIAQSYRARRSNATQATGSSSRFTPSHTQPLQVDEIDDYNDVMMYMETGFPTSTRTLLWDMIQTQQEATVESIRGGGGSFGGGGASADWSPTDTQDGSSSMDAGGSAAGITAAGAGIAAVAVGGVVAATDGFGLLPSQDSGTDNGGSSNSFIATDDRLGAYS
jgi:vacuolar-type H+-ATPase subunit I/STV1